MEDPTVEIDSVSIEGKILMKFNQDMFYPADKTMYDYTRLFGIKITSALTGRIYKAE